MTTKVPKYKVPYKGKNEILTPYVIVEAMNEAQATEKAKYEVSCAYGSELADSFTYLAPEKQKQ